MYRSLPALLVGACLAAGPAGLRAAEPDPKGVEFFEKKIRPVLAEHCYKCHSAQADKLKGGLLLDSRAGIREGGESGPAVVPGKVQESLLLKALRYQDDLKMPPKGKLPGAVVADFVRWVAMGAPDPRDGKAAVAKTGTEKGTKHWAFQTAQKTAPPKVQDTRWPRSDIDRFVLARLEAQGMKPVRDADRLTLLRRAYFDLVGMPPSVEDIEAFLRDTSPRAFEKVVDRLLASPQFGERWGRHWLDVARFAESNGNVDNLPFPHAWRYRDYVIAAFNQDKPYNQFITEQLAGDLLPAADAKQRDAHLVATGFLALGSKPRSQNNPNFQMDLVADQIEVTGDAFLGLTIGCARCHDHKFDPIPTREYYALAGIFTSTDILYGNSLRKIGKTAPTANGLHTLSASSRGNEPAQAMGVKEAARAGDCRVCIRGESNRPGEAVPRGFITAVTVGTPPAIPARQSGRLQLAEWIASPQNPLTARVMVNRLWHHLFGQGLVRTVDNFGATGEKPSHPELLDYLAVRFADGGWSVKKMIRTLMLTRAYQLRGDHDAANWRKDPENHLVWRHRLRRIDAEALRDALLTVSGQIELKPPQGTLSGFAPVKNKSAPVPNKRDNRYRSVYQPIVRNGLPEVLGLFDFADPSLVVGSRDVTTVPAQALFLMNSPFLVEQSRHLARRVLAAPKLDDAGRVELAYKTALSRPPTAKERDRALRFLGEEVEGLKSREKNEERRREAAWTSLTQALLASAEFRYLE
jgi:hypothetical protein